MSTWMERDRKKGGHFVCRPWSIQTGNVIQTMSEMSLRVDIRSELGNQDLQTFAYYLAFSVFRECKSRPSNNAGKTWRQKINQNHSADGRLISGKVGIDCFLVLSKLGQSCFWNVFQIGFLCTRWNIVSLVEHGSEEEERKEKLAHQK